MRRRVVITGMGCITPLGHTVDQLFEAQLAGRSGVGPTFLFNASRFCRHIEQAYVTMMEIARAGEPPRAFDVPVIE